MKGGSVQVLAPRPRKMRSLYIIASAKIYARKSGAPYVGIAFGCSLYRFECSDASVFLHVGMGRGEVKRKRKRERC